MALSREGGACVPQVETPFFPFSKQSTRRIGRVEALDPQLVSKNLRPNVIADVDVNGHPWSVTAVLSPYTSGFHVMLLDLSERYMPDPTHLSSQEGNGLMTICQKIVSFQEKLGGTEINVGYNWSPRSYGEAEEKGGFQSLTTKWHIQFWNQLKATQSVSLDSLTEETRRVILGNSLNKLAGVMIKDYMLGERSFASFLDLGNTVIDSRGIEVPVGEKLKESFAKPEFFSKFLKPLAIHLDGMAREITESFTTLDNSRLEELIRGEFESGTNGMLPVLREDPHLLPYEERIRRIQLLAEKGYSRKVMNLLLGLNRFIKEKANTPSYRWFRKGLGYALVFSQDLSSGRTIMRIMPGIFVEDRGGVVEALGTVLCRREAVDPFQAEEDNEKREVLRRLGEHLQDN